MTKLKAIAEYKFQVARMIISLFDQEENTVEKGENTGYQHFPLPPAFSIAFFLRVVKSRDCVAKNHLVYFQCTKGNHSHYFISTGEPILMESEIVRKASLSTTEISKITRLKI